MKRVALAIALVATPLFAQSVHDEIAFARAHIQSDRDTVVRATLKLTEQQDEVFWPLYREYRTQVSKPMDKLWNLFVTYGQKWDAMSDSDAARLLDEYLGIEKDVLQIKQRYVKAMEAKLGGATTARFFQIDNKLDAIVRMEAASEIPLLTKTK